jgi:hypothetical protein
LTNIISLFTFYDPMGIKQVNHNSLGEIQNEKAPLRCVFSSLCPNIFGK